MRSKVRTVCSECRRRKLGCDGFTPQCSQCILSGRTCPGYPQLLTIIQHCPGTVKGPPVKPSLPEQSQTRLLKAHNVNLSQRPRTSLLGHAGYEDLAHLIIDNYIPVDELHYLSLSHPCSSVQQHARICGSWVEALLKTTRLGKHDGVLLAAMRALCLTFIDRDQRCEEDYIETYCTVLASLREALLATSASAVFEADLAAASMCLTLCEVMMPTSKTGWMSHVKGVGELMRRHGPDVMLHDDVNHCLFLGFRPLIAIEAFFSRKATFLASEAWLKLPQPATPMQSLLSHAAVIPSLLEQTDTILPLGPLSAPQQQSTIFGDPDGTTTVHGLYISFRNALESLDSWEESLLRTAARPLYWPVPPMTTATANTVAADDGATTTTTTPERHPELHFPDVSAANAYIHFWAFRIVCLTHLHLLEPISQQNTCSSLPSPSASVSKSPSASPHMHEILALSTKICQSMPFLLAADMRMYGPASTFFPLKVVHDTLRGQLQEQAEEQEKEEKGVGSSTTSTPDENALSREQQAEVLAWSKDIVAKLVAKGLTLAGDMLEI